MSEPTPDLDAIRARLTAALEPIEPGTQMEAYYYEFNETGLATIDRVLSAVAVAGKHYHNTREWYGEAPSFPNEVEAIQAAANGSAAEVKRLTDDIASLLTENERLRKVADAARDVIYDTQLDGIGVDSDRRLGALSAALDALEADQ